MRTFVRNKWKKYRGKNCPYKEIFNRLDAVGGGGSLGFVGGRMSRKEESVRGTGKYLT